MKTLPYWGLLLIIAGFPFACKKDGKETGPTGPDTPAASKTKEVQVVFPEGSGIDPSACTLMSFSTEFAIDAQGKSKAAFTAGTPTIAYVFNKNDQLLLAGFITDSNSVIDAASTATYLLYHACKIPLQPYAASETFISKIGEVPGVPAWVEEFGKLLAANPLTLDEGTFALPLTKAAKEMIKVERLDIRPKKAADITVDDANVRSGLQVSSDELSKFIVTQTYRRRTHGFLYKKSYKDLDSNLHDLDDFDAPGKQSELTIESVSGINSLTGELGKIIEGNSGESASKINGPYEMQLEDDEIEATYVLRIVGPGSTDANSEPKTLPEKRKQLRLELETFALDLMLPIIMEIVGNKDTYKKNGFDIDDVPVVKFIDEMEVFIKAFPDVYEEIKKGDYEAALGKGLAALWSNTGSKNLDEFVRIAAEIAFPELEEGAAGKMAKKQVAVLKLIDLILASGDVARVFANTLTSKSMEEWKLLARSASVKLNPESKVVAPDEKLKLSAVIKNAGGSEDTHPFFEWSTSGRFGKLSDTKGHTDLAAFESADKDVNYVSKVSIADLQEGDNIDTVFVTAIVGGRKVGTDTAIVNVQKDEYELQPDGITLSCKDPSAGSVRLYLEKADGSNDIKDSSGLRIDVEDSIQHKVIWTTAGKFGKLSGTGEINTTSVTQQDKNWVDYDCTDLATKEGTESFHARIYRKRKSEPAYLLYDEVDGSIIINNDPKWIIRHVRTEFVHTELWSGCERHQNTQCYKAMVVHVPEVNDALTYSVFYYGHAMPFHKDHYFGRKKIMTQYWSPVLPGKPINDSLGRSASAYEWYASHYGEMRIFPYTGYTGSIPYNDCYSAQIRFENGAYITAFKLAQGSNNGVNQHLDATENPGMAVVKIHIR